MGVKVHSSCSSALVCNRRATVCARQRPLSRQRIPKGFRIFRFAARLSFRATESVQRTEVNAAHLVLSIYGTLNMHFARQNPWKRTVLILAGLLSLLAAQLIFSGCQTGNIWMLCMRVP